MSVILGKYPWRVFSTHDAWNTRPVPKWILNCGTIYLHVTPIYEPPSGENFALAFIVVNVGPGNSLRHIPWLSKILDEIQGYQAPWTWTSP